MKNVFKQAMKIVACMAMSSLLFSSCGKESENDREYLAVKMSKNDGWSIIDKNGKVVVDDEYSADSDISAVYDGVYWIKTDGSFQLFNVKNPKKPLIDEEFAMVTEFSARRAAVSVIGKPIRIIDTSGKTIATLGKSVKRVAKFSEDGFAVFMNSDEKFGVMDKNGKVVIKAEYNYIVPFINDGIVLAQKNEYDEKVIILNTTGERLGTIDVEKYEPMGMYSEGKILVVNKDNNRQEVFNKEGRKLFTVDKSKVVDNDYYGYNVKYIDGYAIFRKDDKYGVVDSDGNTVIRAKYRFIINLGKGEFAVSKDAHKGGIVNAEDEKILEFNYSEVHDIKVGGNYLVKDGDEYLLIRRGGKNEILASFYAISLSLNECGFVDYIDNVTKGDEHNYYDTHNEICDTLVIDSVVCDE